MRTLLTFVISTTFDILQILILIRVFLSWIPHDHHSQLSIFLLSVTEPILGPIRNNIPLNSGGIDFSPIAAFFIIGFLKKVILFAV